MLTMTFERIMNTYGFIMDSFGKSFSESRYKSNLQLLDYEIREAEEAAKEEQEKEVSEALFKEMTDTWSKAGREIAAAFESGLNTRK